MCACSVSVWPASLIETTSVLGYGWPEASWAAPGHTMLPDLTVIAVLPTWVSGTEIEPSGWTMNVELVAVCGIPDRSFLLFMITRSPPAPGVTEATWLVTVPFIAVSFSWYTQVSPTAIGKMAGAVTVPRGSRGTGGRTGAAARRPAGCRRRTRLRRCWTGCRSRPGPARWPRPPRAAAGRGCVRGTCGPWLSLTMRDGMCPGRGERRSGYRQRGGLESDSSQAEQPGEIVHVVGEVTVHHAMHRQPKAGPACRGASFANSFSSPGALFQAHIPGSRGGRP